MNVTFHSSHTCEKYSIHGRKRPLYRVDIGGVRKIVRIVIARVDSWVSLKRA